MILSTRKLLKTFFLTVILALILFPFYIIIVNSFKSKQEIFSNVLNLPNSFDLSNFTMALAELDFFRSFSNSLIISLFSILLIIIASPMAAYALQRSPSRLSGGFFFLFSAVFFIPFQSVMIPLVSLAGKLNMLNRGGLIFFYLGFFVSLAIFLYYGALKGIPKSLDEAGLIDGANRCTIFFRIIFPLLKPMSTTVAILVAIGTWNDYLLPSLIINRPGLETIPLKVFYFFGQYTKQWHLAMAALLISILPIVLFYAFAQKVVIGGLTTGAIKG